MVITMVNNRHIMVLILLLFSILFQLSYFQIDLYLKVSLPFQSQNLRKSFSANHRRTEQSSNLN